MHISVYIYVYDDIKIQRYDPQDTPALPTYIYCFQSFFDIFLLAIVE